MGGKRRVACASSVAVAVVAVGFAAYTPVEDRYVRNDTQATVVVSYCDSDPITIRPGQTEPIQTNTGAPKRCDVDDREPDARCLIVDHDIVARISDAVPTACSHPRSQPPR